MKEFKSVAQRQKFQELVAKGEVSQETFDEIDRHTAKSCLPTRLHEPEEKKIPKWRKRHQKTHS